MYTGLHWPKSYLMLKLHIFPIVSLLSLGMTYFVPQRVYHLPTLPNETFLFMFYVQLLTARFM